MAPCGDKDGRGDKKKGMGVHVRRKENKLFIALG